MNNEEQLIPDRIANILAAYIEKFAELAALEAKVRMLKSQFKDDRDLVWGADAAAIFGWDDLPKREEKKEETDD